MEATRRGSPPRRDELRTAELRTFLAAPPEQLGELPDRDERFFARSAIPEGGLPEGISKLVLAKKLREIRVQLGFTRFEAPAQNLQGEYDLGVEMAPLGFQTDWLPATEVLGEGFLIQLDESAVRDWEKRPAVQARAKILADGYAAWQRREGGALPFPGARFYLLHSLAHLLISAVSLECGYPASAIRERIYCMGAESSFPMAAILLSTGTSGAEGTLGGLVEEGRQLRTHLERALASAERCSNDPVCAGHKPDGPSDRKLEGAACHGCLFVAECSCERFNRFLDRALVIPTLATREAAYFGAAHRAR